MQVALARLELNIVTLEISALRVGSQVNRCPFCHETVHSAESVVCQDCLARHHEDCWTEGGACSSCSSLNLLSPDDDNLCVDAALLNTSRRVSSTADMASSYFGAAFGSLLMFLLFFTLSMGHWAFIPLALASFALAVHCVSCARTWSVSRVSEPAEFGKKSMESNNSSSNYSGKA